MIIKLWQVIITIGDTGVCCASSFSPNVYILPPTSHRSSLPGSGGRQSRTTTTTLLGRGPRLSECRESRVWSPRLYEEFVFRVVRVSLIEPSPNTSKR